MSEVMSERSIIDVVGERSVPFYRRHALKIASAALVSLSTAVALPFSGAFDENENVEPAAPSALPTDMAARPLGTPPPAPAGEDGYNPYGTQPDGSSITWDPCRPIHYVINPEGAPHGGEAAINTAIKTVSETTGLQFVYDGTTAEDVVPGRPAMNEKLYGNRWSPVIVDWVTPEDYPDMEGYAGLGGPDTAKITGSDEKKYVSGVVILNQQHLAEVVTRPDGQERLNGVVTHEFAHLVGLGHSNEPDQLMSARPLVFQLADGDLRGLASMGSGECYPDAP